MTLASELDFEETEQLQALHAAAVRAIQAGELPAQVEAIKAYKIAAMDWVETRLPTSYAPIGCRIAIAAIWLEGGARGEALDELWDAAYQAGQTPGIETLREVLEGFVMTFDETSE